MKKPIMNKQRILIAALVGASALFSPLTYAQATSSNRTAGEVIDDSVITTKVKAELLREQATKSLKISVKTTDGVVNLTGTVSSTEQMDSALRVTRAVKGVTDVKNNLQLRSK